MPPCNCHPPFPRPEPFSPLPRPGKVPDWGKWIRDRLAEKGALLVFPTRATFPEEGAWPNLYLDRETGAVYRWENRTGYAVLVDPREGNDVLVYDSVAAFPDEGEQGKLYIAANTGSLYRWGGEGYVALLESKADKAVPQAAGNFAALTQGGNLADSGKKPADFATAAQGAKADTAVQSVVVGSITVTPGEGGALALPVSSSATSDSEDALATPKAVKTVNDKVTAIEDKIPAQATAQNQLADKAFVNSSVSTNTATFRGTYNLVTDLELTVAATQEQIATAISRKMEVLSISPDNNDYCFVQIPTGDETPTEISRVDRYKCVESEQGGVKVVAWEYEWSLNNSSFTAAQWAAINSGITSGLVAKLGALPTMEELTQALAGKADDADVALNAAGYSDWDLSSMPSIFQGGRVELIDHKTPYPWGYRVYSSTDPSVYAYPIDSYRTEEEALAATSTRVNYSNVVYTITRTALGYRLGPDSASNPNRDKTLASEAEAEALRQGKQDALSPQQLANIAAVPNKLDATNGEASGLVLLGGEYSGYQYAVRFSMMSGVGFMRVDILRKLPSATTWSTVGTQMFQNATGTLALQDDIPILGISVNGTLLPPTNKLVNIPVPSASASAPLMDGTGSAGSSAAFARGDHVHPSDSAKLDKSGGTMTGGLTMGGGNLITFSDSSGTRTMTIGINGDIFEINLYSYGTLVYTWRTPYNSGVFALASELLTKLDSTSAAPAFSSDSTVQYPVGSHCTYQGKLYKCTTATTGGTWVAASWTEDVMDDPDAVLDITSQNQLRVVAKDGTLLWAQGYDLASTSSATLACDAVNNFTFADGATTQAFALPTAPSGKAGDFGLDIDNSANASAVTMTLTGLDTTFSIVVPKGESLNDMLSIAAGELARFYITLSTFRVNNLPTWHIMKQIVENGGATV